MMCFQTGSVIVFEATRGNSPNDTKLRVFYNNQPEAVDLGFYSQYLQRTNNACKSMCLQEVLDHNQELLEVRKSNPSCEFTLQELQELNHLLQPFVHNDRRR
jgi:hypothetical protein